MLEPVPNWHSSWDLMVKPPTRTGVSAGGSKQLAALLDLQPWQWMTDQATWLLGVGVWDPAGVDWHVWLGDQGEVGMEAATSCFLKWQVSAAQSPLPNVHSMSWGWQWCHGACSNPGGSGDLWSSPCSQPLTHLTHRQLPELPNSAVARQSVDHSPIPHPHDRQVKPPPPCIHWDQTSASWSNEPGGQPIR